MWPDLYRRIHIERHGWALDPATVSGHSNYGWPLKHWCLNVYGFQDVISYIHTEQPITMPGGSYDRASIKYGALILTSQVTSK